MRTQSDARLSELTSAGSEPAFEAIVARYRRSLVCACARVVGDADAEEAAQDALMKAHAALLRGDPVRRLAPWLHVIAHNTALSYLRARASRPLTADVDYECGCTVDVSAEYREEFGEVIEAVRALPDRQRSAIVMREFEGRSYDEIAARLGSSNGAVRQLLNRARSSVRERVGALMPVGLIVRLALAGAGGGEAAGGATLSGACVLGAKACVAALIPATVAIVASAPAPRHGSPTTATRTVATAGHAPRAGGGKTRAASTPQVSYIRAALTSTQLAHRSQAGGRRAVITVQRASVAHAGGSAAPAGAGGSPNRGAGSNTGGSLPGRATTSPTGTRSAPGTAPMGSGSSSGSAASGVSSPASSGSAGPGQNTPMTQRAGQRQSAAPPVGTAISASASPGQPSNATASSAPTGQPSAGGADADHSSGTG